MHVSRDVIVIIIMLAEITCVNKNFSLLVFFSAKNIWNIQYSSITLHSRIRDYLYVTSLFKILSHYEWKKERKKEGTKKKWGNLRQIIFLASQCFNLSHKIYISPYFRLSTAFFLSIINLFSRSYRRSFNICPREIYIHSFIFVNGYWRKISFFAVFFLV